MNYTTHQNRDYLTTLEEERIARIRAEKKLEYRNAELINLQNKIEVIKKVLKRPLPSNNAEQDNEIKDFAYIVAHDLKAPLNSINTLIYWLTNDCEDSLTSNNIKILNQITRNVNKMYGLIHGVLEYSSIDNRYEEITSVDVGTVIDDIQEMIIVPDSVSINITEDLPVINANKYRIQQVFQNLIVNAIKHSNKEDCQINISWSDEHDFWKFKVTDNGKGIPYSQCQKIFKAFHSGSKDNRSSGLGLSIVKKIIHHYSGKIWVDSKLGIGTSFIFTIKK